MTSKCNLRSLLAASLLVALPLSACGQDSFDDPDSIGQALNEVNGGLDMESEAPLFGEEQLFEEADFQPEVALLDPLEEEPDTAALIARRDILAVHARIRWGQFPADPDAVGRDWSGTLSVNRGAILVRGTIGFEALDTIAERDDRLSLDFVSNTRPANDGLRLLILDPTPGADEPMVLDYSTADGSVYSVEVRDLVDAPQVAEVDTEGNRIVVTGIARAVDPCSSGFLRGRWHKVAEHRGRLLGQVRAADGDLLGHMRGVYGERANGNRVFFGKYINVDGEFRGIFAGRYQNGHFLGRWMSRAGEIGALGGQYRETIPGPEVGGHYRGRWAETSCNLRVGPGVEMPDQP